MADSSGASKSLAAADAELSGWFLEGRFLHGQSYESGGGNDANAKASAAHDAMIRLASSGASRQHDAIGATIAGLSVEHRRVAVAVYMPHGAPVWLASALSTPWGAGNLLGLATSLPRAVKAAAGRDDGLTVLDWLQRRGTKGNGDALLRSLRDDAEVVRIEMLAAYDVLRRARADARRRQQRSEVSNLDTLRRRRLAVPVTEERQSSVHEIAKLVAQALAEAS